MVRFSTLFNDRSIIRIKKSREFMSERYNVEVEDDEYFSTTILSHPLLNSKTYKFEFNGDKFHNGCSENKTIED